MTDFSIDFLGCKISQTDAEAVRDALTSAGHHEREVGSVRVLNTCCITAEAEKKSRKRVRRLLAEDEQARVFVTGCGATLRPEVYDDLGTRVTTLPGAAALAAPAIVAAADELADLACKGPLPGRLPRQHTRAFVKIQDGCSFECSYCIVPAVRGASRSRPRDVVLEEVARRVARGQREIVLTGVNIGLYRDPESRVSLPGLLPDVADVPGVARVRISSIEVNHVSRRLVEAMASHPKVCPHLHVPLQSGSDGVLAGMRRHYDSSRYAQAIERARALLPHLNLTTDVIVGFPDEDDAAFEETLAFAERMAFTKVHAFPFSPRPGTDAAEALDPVPAVVKQERSRRLRAAADARALAHWQSRVGTRDEVVVERGGSRRGMALSAGHAAAAGEDGEEGDPTDLGGYTRDYCPVRLVDDVRGVEQGELVEVELVGADVAGLRARVVRRPSDGSARG